MCLPIISYTIQMNAYSRVHWPRHFILIPVRFLHYASPSGFDVDLRWTFFTQYVTVSCSHFLFQQYGCSNKIGLLLHPISIGNRSSDEESSPTDELTKSRDWELVPPYIEKEANTSSPSTWFALSRPIAVHNPFSEVWLNPQT